MRSRFLLVLGLLVTGTFVGTARPAAAAPEQVIPISGGITITGHGFGHGRGMSQYGAQGRAIQGVKWPQIVDFYYPGTTLTTVSGELTVLITADDDTDTVVLPKTGLSIADYGAGKVYTLPTTIGAKAWKLYASNGKFKVSYQNNGWHAYAPGGNPTLVGMGEFRTKSYTVTLRTPDGDRTYRGAIRRTHGHSVNRTGIESYVKGVVAREMPASWRLEALSAQAVAARTYAAYYRANPKDATYDLCDTTACQVYGGLADETVKTTEAVTRTAGKVLGSTYPDDHGYAIAEFSSSNGGWTTAGQTRPYLQAKQDTFEQYASNPNANWSVPLNAAALQAKYGGTLGTLKSLQVLARTGDGDWGGRVTDIKLWGTKNGVTTSVTLGGSQFRSDLGLKSTYFTLLP
jgi:SpoIID/LytB domain protein